MHILKIQGVESKLSTSLSGERMDSQTRNQVAVVGFLFEKMRAKGCLGIFDKDDGIYYF